MKFEKLECVALVQNRPQDGLQAGDLGTIVEIYPCGGLEIEFVTCSGSTQALLTLNEHQVRKVGSHDLLAARHL